KFPSFCLMLLFMSCGVGHPPFDRSTPDTKNNKYHFRHLVNLEPSTDVHGLYTYGNEMGIDASYLLTFKCGPETVLQIIKSNDMELDDQKGTVLYGIGTNVSWWNVSDIDTLTRYIYSSENERYFRYFWYNDYTNQGYFLYFDL
ncbi:MAG: hypothetical protein ACI8SE_002274, partial [Bacteroidia bacterium]